MPIVHAIVLGLVQGLSEFLPISSSGHLLLVPWLFDWHDFDDPDIEKTFDVALHLGTAIAAIIYLRRDLARYIGAGVRMVVRRETPPSVDGRIAWLLLLSVVPAAAIGALFESAIDERLGTPTIIAVSLIVFGLVLGYTDRLAARREIEGYRTRDAVIIGAAQALALNPGTSRSGITMTAARWAGFSRAAAARISFLMMIPVTCGALAFKLVGLVGDEGGIPSELRVPMLVGIITSGISGWIAVWGLLRFVSTRTFTPFVVYRVALGVIVLIVVAAGWR